MVRKWTWILPTFWWRWVFKTTARLPVIMAGKRCEAVNIDREFVLVRVPIEERTKQHLW